MKRPQLRIRFERDRRATLTARTAVRWCAAVIVRGPGRPIPPRTRAFQTLADVHRRVAPIKTSLEWLLLFASHQNVINSRKMLGLV